jgi:ATP-binding cassette subfamily B protein
MAGNRLRYLLAVSATFGGTLVGYMPPVVLGLTIDAVIAGRPLGEAKWVPGPVVALGEALGGTSVLGANLWICGIAIVLLTAVSGAFLYLKGRWTAKASEGISCTIRNRMYDHMQNLPCRYYDKVDTGDLVQRCTSDIETIHTFLSIDVVDIGRAVILVLTVVPIMLYLNWPMALVSMALIPPIVAFGAMFFLKVRRAFQASDEAEGRMTARLQENLTGIRVVRAFANQDHECRRFDEVNRDFRDLDYRLYRLLAVFWPVSDVMCFAQRGLVLFAGAYLVTRSSAASAGAAATLSAQAMTVGKLLIFFRFVDMFLWPVRHVGRTLTNLGKAQVAIGRLREVLDEQPETVTPSAGPAPDEPPVAGAVAFRGVSFAFRECDDAHVLRDVSFEIEPGQSLAILGPSGAGKSTIVNLLLRLYEPRAGSILLDGTDIREMDRHAVRGRIGVIMQEPFLYSKSLRENIKLGRSSASDEEMIAAASAACIHSSVEHFDEGYETRVGERGVTLSGGQRQRVAIARAILKDPPVLVMDDALSAVDTRTERMILDALKRRRGRHTTILIAHRLSTLQHADRIVVLDRGRVIQRGTHESLLGEADGLYRRLWTIQNAVDAEEALAAASGRYAPGDPSPIEKAQGRR